jgi:hypothetical protein
MLSMGMMTHHSTKQLTNIFVVHILLGFLIMKNYRTELHSIHECVLLSPKRATSFGQQ